MRQKPPGSIDYLLFEHFEEEIFVHLKLSRDDFTWA